MGHSTPVAGTDPLLPSIGEGTTLRSGGVGRAVEHVDRDTERMDADGTTSASRVLARAIVAMATGDPGFDAMVPRVLDALSERPFQLATGWMISADGTRMRRADLVGGEERPWEAVSGPVREVLTARRPVEMAVQDAWLSPAPLDADPTDPAHPFGRFVPAWHRSELHPRVAFVLGVVRAPGAPVFQDDDRIALDAVVNRLQAALDARLLEDELATIRSTRFQPGAIVLDDELLDRLGRIGGDFLFRHVFDRGTEYVSSGVETALGWTVSDFRDDRLLLERIVHADDRQLFAALAEDPHASDHPVMLRMLRRDGKVSWQYFRVMPVVDRHQRVLGVEGIATDVTPMKLNEAELEMQARTDGLTGLANRLQFREATARALARLERHPGHTLGVLFMDLTGFKAVNDSMGHAAGDAALISVGDRLRRVIRREDLVARLGGDEFAVLLAEVKPGEAEATARRILTAIEMPIPLSGTQVRISTGIGIALESAGGITPEELVHRADVALYQAKRAGRGRWQVFEGSHGSADTETAPLPGTRGAEGSLIILPPASAPTLTVSDDILDAAMEHGDLRVHYQPEIDLSTGRVVAVEALLRWQHPELGLLPAAAFIHQANNNEFIHTLAGWITQEAARQVAQWQRTFDTRLRLWIDFGVTQLARPGAAERILTALAAGGLAPRDAGIEIPEIAITSLPPEAETAIDVLHRAGFRVAVDGFGTGSSSVRSLRRLPLDRIKLDRSLVREIDRPVDGVQDLASLALQLAGSLGLEAAAVGVERESQLDRLRELGCSFAQGFLIGRPEPADRVAARLAQTTPSFTPTH